MPVSYSFTDPATDKTVPLAQVDNELREALGLPSNEHQYSDEFNILTWMGIAAYFNGAIDETKLPRTHSWEEAHERAIYVSFLTIRYRFSCWRQC